MAMILSEVASRGLEIGSGFGSNYVFGLVSGLFKSANRKDKAVLVSLAKSLLLPSFNEAVNAQIGIELVKLLKEIKTDKKPEEMLTVSQFEKVAQVAYIVFLLGVSHATSAQIDNKMWATKILKSAAKSAALYALTAELKKLQEKKPLPGAEEVANPSDQSVVDETTL